MTSWEGKTPFRVFMGTDRQREEVIFLARNSAMG